MRIGNTRISGFSKRFWFVLVAIIVLIIAAVSLAPHNKPPETFTNPAFAASDLGLPALASDNWINSYESYYGNGHPLTAQTPATFSSDYTADIGKPYRFEVYLDSTSDVQTTRPDLLVNRDNYTCEVGFFLTPNQPYSEEQLSNLNLGSDSDALQLCFRAGAAPSTGQAYDVTGLLWWDSELFSPLTATELANEGSSATTVPTILVADAAPLDSEELANPATQKVNLNLVYEERGYELTVRDIEWRANSEVRACVSLTNLSQYNSAPMWQGVSASTARDASGQGAVTATTDANGAFASGGELEPAQTLTGWLIFDGPQASDPTQGLTLQMPSLQPNQTNSDAIQINIPASQIQPVAQSVTPESSCSGVTNPTLSSTGGSSASSGSSSAAAGAGGTSGDQGITLVQP